MGTTSMIIRRIFTVIALSCAALLTPMAASSASAVNAFEWNYTVDGDVNGSENCASVAGGQPQSGISGCFHPAGDQFWAHDFQRDGLSAAVYWYNYSDGALYRHGACVEKRGSGESGWCNKNFREGSTIRFKLCFLDVPTGVEGDCGPLSRAIES
jgi:hypothetical protein